MLKFLKRLFSKVERVEPLDPASPAKPFLGGRINNALYRYFIETQVLFTVERNYPLTVGEFLQIMAEEPDKHLLRVSNMGKIGVAKCREIEPILRKRVEAFNAS